MPGTSTEPVMLLRFIRDTLAADSEIAASGASVSVLNADEGDAFPRIVIEAPPSGPMQNALENNSTRIWAEPRAQISVISQDASIDDAAMNIDAVAARIDTLLHGLGSEPTTGGEIVTMTLTNEWLEGPLEENGYHSTIVQQYSTAVRAV